jgi:diguanylate cyclase (GGDEF)-like protein
MWVQSWLIQPVSRAMGSLVPPELSSIDSSMLEVEAFLTGSGNPLPVDYRFLPIIKRALLEQKRTISERQEQLRIKTPHGGLRTAVDDLMNPVSRFISQPWFKVGETFQLPTLTDFLTLQAAHEVMPTKLDSFKEKYDEKFGFLHSQAEFLPRLRNCRIESWLRRIGITVAFVDVDNFKQFNTKYNETIVDRDLLPKLMQTLEAHVFAHGWAYRFGGDEYVLLLPNMTLEQAESFLRELQTKFLSLRFVGISESITISVGICTVWQDSFLTDREILDAADRAKQEAKKVPGKGRIAKIVEAVGQDEEIRMCDQ